MRMSDDRLSGGGDPEKLVLCKTPPYASSRQIRGLFVTETAAPATMTNAGALQPIVAGGLSPPVGFGGSSTLGVAGPGACRAPPAPAAARPCVPTCGGVWSAGL